MSPEQIQLAIDEARQLKVDARSLRREGETTAALKHFADAQDIALELASLPKNDRSDEVLLLLAECETGLGYTLHNQASYDETYQRLGRAISLRAELARNDFPDPNLLAHRALVHYNVAKAHNEDPKADVRDAFSNCEASFHQFRKVLESNTPDDQRIWVNQFLRVANLYAHCLSQKGRHGDVINVCETALRVANRHQRFLQYIDEVAFLTARRALAEFGEVLVHHEHSVLSSLFKQCWLYVRIYNWFLLKSHFATVQFEQMRQRSQFFWVWLTGAAKSKRQRYLSAVEVLSEHAMLACSQAIEVVFEFASSLINLAAPTRAGPDGRRWLRPYSNFLPGSGVRPWRPLLARGDSLPT